MFGNNLDYGIEIPVMPPLHASHLNADPQSMVDLKYNRKEHEVAAHVALGLGYNSLGQLLVIPANKSYLIPELEKWKVKYRIKV